jgi:hypothetical protein
MFLQQCNAYHVPEDADAIVAQAMTDLSNKERDQVLHDIHGVSDETKETPEMIAQSLEQLQDEIQKIKNKGAYDLARSQNSNYVYNRHFRLRFLRTDLFDIRNAALRLVQHFKVKLDLFGRNKLVKDITQEDLNENDMKNLYSGYFQTLPQRDPAGRLISVWLAHPKQSTQGTYHGLLHKVCRPGVNFVPLASRHLIVPH